MTMYSAQEGTLPTCSLDPSTAEEVSLSTRSTLVLIIRDPKLSPQEKAHLFSIHPEARQALRLPWTHVLTCSHCFLSGQQSQA